MNRLQHSQAARPTQSASVERSRLRCPAGRKSETAGTAEDDRAYLRDEHHSHRGVVVGSPPSINRLGAGACTTPFSQARQAYLGRRTTSTRNCAGTISSRSPVSSPI